MDNESDGNIEIDLDSNQSRIEISMDGSDTSSQINEDEEVDDGFDIRKATRGLKGSNKWLEDES